MTFDGIQLTLLIGPAVPAPAPQVVIDSLESVDITSSTDRSGFQLKFKVGPRSILQTTLLPSGFFDPIITRVIVVVTVRGLRSVLIDGIVTRHEMNPSNQAGQSTLTITGEDLSLLMDLVEMPFVRFVGLPVVARVFAILAKYAALGIAPVALPVIDDLTNPVEKFASQHGTDRAYLKKLATDAGYVFYVEPGPTPGANTAYFGPDVRISAPQPALTINMGGQSNVDSLSFSLDGVAKKIVVMTVMDPVTRRIPIPVPVPNINLLRPPLGARVTLPAKVEFPSNSAPLPLNKALSDALGLSFRSSDAVTGTGSLDVLIYGRVLRSRMIVGVRGAGVTYDGLYYVNSVTHSLQRGKFKQNFSLSRDGLVSQTSAVPP
jgi:hypothetical protein